MYGLIGGVLISYLLLKVYLKKTCGICDCKTSMFGKVVLITGANTGIGFETALDMARKKAKVILACRDLNKASAARNKIIQDSHNENVIIKKLDLCSLASVRECAKEILETEPRLDVLINNAGMGVVDNALTVDKLPIEAQVNHFGPFLLTNMLLPLLKASTPARIVNVSSLMHKFGKIDVEKFHKQGDSILERRRVYSNTKLANILFTKKLSKDLQGTGVTVNCLHPGAVSTDIFRNQYRIVKFLIGLVFKTPWEGAQTSIHLACSPDLENTTGKYFVDCKEALTSNDANDIELAEKLWHLSENVVFGSEKSI